MTGFRIARYPVTWAQYRAFLAANDGFGDERWWSGLDQFDWRFDPDRRDALDEQ